MSKPHFCLITYEGLPDLDPDDRLIVDELSARGYSSSIAVWDDSSINWSEAGVCIVRSTWDYHLKLPAFLKWVRHVNSKTTLFNPANTITYNANKQYLLQLRSQGVATVPTVFLHKDSQMTVAEAMRTHKWGSFIVKPTVGLATHGLRLFDGSPRSINEAQEHATALMASSEVMLQPFFQSVEEYGERALIFINGRYSHAVEKTPFQPLAAAGKAGERGVTAEDQEIAFASMVLQAVPFNHLYARVDLVRDNDHNINVLELELIEPSLFLTFHPPAAKALVDAILSQAQIGATSEKH
jgi:glutathione synthase/RimK-type ligase-like ATP-grasp enzyme